MRFLAIPILILISCCAYSQDAQLAEKYLLDYQAANTDSAKCRNLWQVAFNLSGSDPRKGIEYGKQALDLAQKIKDFQLMGDSHNSLGFCFDSAGNADSARYHFDLSLQAFDQAGLICEKAGVYSNIGNSQKRRGETAKALESFLQAIEIQQNCPDIGYHGSTIYSIGTCYNALEDYNRALEYFEKSLQIEISNNNRSKQGYCHNGKANAYLGLSQLDDARKEYSKAKKAYEESGDIANVAYIYEGLAQLNEKDAQLDSAIIYASLALDIFNKINVNYDIVYESLLLSDLWIKAGNWKKADSLLQSALPLSVASNLHYDRQQILSKLSLTSEQRGDYEKAFTFLKAAELLADSLQLSEQKTKLAELAGQYETEKRDKQIALQLVENQKRKNQNYLFIAISIIFLIIALFFLNRFIQKKKSNALLESKNIEIEKARLKAEESEKIKEQFLANMSHEIRTPMNAIIGLSGLLREQSFDSTTDQYIKAINHSGSNLLVVLNDILDLSKIQSGTLRIQKNPLNLNNEWKSLELIFSPIAAQKKIKLDFYLDPELSTPVNADGSRLNQVLNNLISNALKFSDQGEVNVAVCIDPKNNTLHFSVKDTGPGIAPEDQKNIFEDFVQTEQGSARKYGGTGLGLSIAKKLVAAMGGHLELESTVGKGSVFYFDLPYEPMPQSIDETATFKESLFKSTAKIRVLIAEDNDYNYLLSSASIAKYFPNAEIHRACNGEEALEDALQEEYDLVLMDVQMPGMDGYEASERIREKDKELPIIALTASVIPAEIQRCLDSGMNDYLPKPFLQKDFLMKIAQWTGIKLEENNNNSSDYLDYESLFKELIPSKIQQMEVAIAGKELGAIPEIIHQLKPQLLRWNEEQYGVYLEHLEFGTVSDSNYAAELAAFIQKLKLELQSIRS